jgi:NTE family protein
MFIHSIDAQDITKDLAASSKMNMEWSFLTRLFELGRQRAETWLADSFDHIGAKTTVDLQAEYF